ncbi:MAG: Scr1 family TA system antitoxin-like transcriptional regulator [Mycobacteriales bacterium]
MTDASMFDQQPPASAPPRGKVTNGTAYHPTQDRTDGPATDSGHLVSRGRRVQTRMDLAGRLVELRKNAGLSRAQVAQKMSCSVSKIVRIEATRTGVKPQDLLLLLDLYGLADVGERDRLAALAAEGRRRTARSPQQAPHQTGSQPESQPGPAASRLLALEAAAHEILIYAPHIPDLLQSETYAAALLAGCGPLGLRPWDHGGQMQILRQRQARLRPPRAAWVQVILDESAVHAGAGQGRVEQLAHLIGLTAWPNITIQLLPLHTGPFPRPGAPFTVLIDSRPRLVHLGGLVDRASTSRANEFSDLFQRLRKLALSPWESQLAMQTLLSAFLAVQTTEAAALGHADGQPFPRVPIHPAADLKGLLGSHQPSPKGAPHAFSP